jgi:hypothetical protein
MSIQQVSNNFKANTNQTGRQVLWGAAGYSLGPYNPETGLVLVKSPRQKTPYKTFLLPRPDGKQCNCRGFQTYRHCRHTDLSHPVGAWIWEACFLSVGEESGANAGQSVPVKASGMYPDIPPIDVGLDDGGDVMDGEAEAVNRWAFSEWEVA